MSVYQVTGQRGYRGHKPGETFEAHLDPGTEHRGIRRGNIILIDRCDPELQPNSYHLPKGWANNQHQGGATDG